ncbi:MAG: S-adenosylmethionine:tRNA ribosyltransferase-isomerase [Bacteroidetes bacterium]|nr:MAG: S-adenosylmethionine:tRNA ribosyltransferase-isomerase [Bacteroidota bacterium]
MNIKEIQIEDYYYDLPNEKIAKYPLKKREESKLLIYKSGSISHKHFYDIPEILSKNDLVIFNSTKVIQARLLFHKKTGAKIEIFCLEPYEPADYEQIFQTKKKCKWKCNVGNSKKWKSGKLSFDYLINGKDLTLFAERISTDNNSQIIEFTWENSDFSFAEILENAGETPIPPYLNRNSEESDKTRYQTVYSKQKGSVAAPTAGLHFTEDLIKELQDKGIKTSELILHVGAGTFKPVKTKTIDEHEMHTEHFIVTENLISELISNLNHIVSVGTTSVRTLESLYWLGVKLENNNNLNKFHIYQWEVYKLPVKISVEKALNNILKYLKNNHKKYIEATTQIIIVPGYQFKIINKLITNFHQPKSTLLLLIAAFTGNNWQKIYNYALNNKFRFLSYGDSSILIP